MVLFAVKIERENYSVPSEVKNEAPLVINYSENWRAEHNA
jgi:hypothetical protein